MCIVNDAMKHSSASKPKGSRDTAQVNQHESGLSHGEFEDQTTSLDQNTQQHIRELISRRELAARWGVCPHTIARRRDLKPVRFGRRLLRYRLGDVLAIEAAAAA